MYTYSYIGAIAGSGWGERCDRLPAKIGIGGDRASHHQQ